MDERQVRLLHYLREIQRTDGVTRGLSFAKILSAFEFNNIQHCHPQAPCDNTRA